MEAAELVSTNSPPSRSATPMVAVVFSLVSADTQGSPAGTSREERSGCGKDPLVEALTGRPGLRVLMALDSLPGRSTLKTCRSGAWYEWVLVKSDLGEETGVKHHPGVHGGFIFSAVKIRFLGFSVSASAQQATCGSAVLFNLFPGAGWVVQTRPGCAFGAVVSAVRRSSQS